MSLCPVCGENMCDHTLQERGQAHDEMIRPLSPEEEWASKNFSSGSPEKIAVARKHAHDPVI